MEIGVRQVNDAPEVGSISATVNEGGRVSINIEGSDLEGDDITYILVSGVNDVSFHGTAYIEGSVVVYEHDGGESTSDLLKYKATDGDLETRPREIEITIYEVNDAPEGESMELETMEDAELEITLIGTDVDTSSSELEYVITVSYTHLRAHET